jgi:hypothetical protein
MVPPASGTCLTGKLAHCLRQTRNLGSEMVLQRGGHPDDPVEVTTTRVPKPVDYGTSPGRVSTVLFPHDRMYRKYVPKVHCSGILQRLFSVH